MDTRGVPAVVAENIEQVIKIEEALINRRSFTERIVGQCATFMGTPYFVGAQIIVLAAWILINSGLTKLQIFDPFPFSLFSLIMSFEAILFAAIILMRQKRQDVIGDRREHLSLQVSLLTEREVTQVIRMLERLNTHVGLDADELSAQFNCPVNVREMVDVLHDRLPDALLD